jgi:two-component system NtrC family sensor kinase
MMDQTISNQTCAAAAEPGEAPALSQYFDGSPVPAFVIDRNHTITHWNKACEEATGIAAAEVVGTRDHWRPFYPKPRPVLADLILDCKDEQTLHSYYGDKIKPSSFIPDGYEVEDFFPALGDAGRWLFFSAAPLRTPAGRVIGAIETLQDISARKRAEQELQKTQAELERQVAERTAQLAQAKAKLEIDIAQRQRAEAELLRRNAKLTELNEKLSMAQQQLMQSEKLASIGQLAAGVAHEINNPIGYIFSNFNSLETYIDRLLEMLACYEEAESAIGTPGVAARLKDMREQTELEYLKEDIPVLMRESKEGIVRVRKIVQDLKDFSRVDSGQDWQWANLHHGIDSTLNVVHNEVKYKADVVKEYGDIPDIECLPSQLNQVVMNLVVNAAHAIGAERGRIAIRTGGGADAVWFEVEDNGCGIPEENLSRIFDPFFTTKPVGKGTGLGLSLSYGIVQKHHGKIEVDSAPGRGTRFRITLPVRQPEPEPKA